MSASDCPSENELLSFVDGELAVDERGSIEEHLDGCDACHALLADLAAMITPERDADDASAEPVRRDDEGAENEGEDDEGTDDESAEAKRRYQLKGRLGSGGMGVVYEAFDRKLQRRVALKLLRPDISRGGGGNARERLLREARLLASLAHPNVVTVHDVGAWDDGVFVAAELVRGRSLDQAAEPKRADEPDRVDEPKRADEPELDESRPTNALGGWRAAAEVYLQAARGLAAAHAVGIVHRDVKPANLLLGEDGRVRLTDFGLATARVAEGDEAAEQGDTPARQPTLTRQGTLLGTPAYMAPELLAGSAATEAADQYALCLSLAEAIVGERPPPGLRPEELLARAREAGQRLPAALAQLLSKGMATRPDRRHGSVEEVVEQLDRLLQTPARRQGASGKVLLAAVAVAALLAIGWLARRPAAVQLAAGALLSAARGLMLATGISPGPHPDAEQDPPAPAASASGEPAPASAPTPASSQPAAGVAPPSAWPPLALVVPTAGASGRAVMVSGPDSSKSLPVQLAMIGQRAHTAASQGDQAACLRAEKRLDGLETQRPEVKQGQTRATYHAIRHMLAICKQPRDKNQLSVRLAKLGGRVHTARANRDVAACRALGQELNALRARHPDLSKPPLHSGTFAIESQISGCLATVDCDAAFERFAKSYRTNFPDVMPADQLEAQLPKIFHSSFPECAP